MTEYLYNPIRIGAALVAVGPRDAETQRIISKDSLIWKRKPYLHEYVLTHAYFGLSERRDVVDKKYIENITYILEWISGLNEADYSGNRKIPDRINVLFLDERSKKIMREQINFLKEDSEGDNREALLSLRFMLTACVGNLSEYGILANDFDPPEPAEYV